MLTIFHLSQWTGAVTGIALGFFAGHRYFGGIPGTVIATLFGYYIGGALGRLPFALSSRWISRELKRSSIETLRSRLDKEYYLSHLIMAEMVSRGEPVESFQPYILTLLHSDSSDVRRFGWRNLEIWFPELAEKMKEFNPQSPTEDCQRQLKTLNL